MNMSASEKHIINHRFRTGRMYYPRRGNSYGVKIKMPSDTRLVYYSSGIVALHLFIRAEGYTGRDSKRKS